MPRPNSRHYKGRAKAASVKVVCKCPRCEALHPVPMESQPKIMPRIYCIHCQFARSGDNEGVGWIGACR